MQSLLEILRKTEAYFAAKGIESPKVEAEWLMAHVLGCRRLELYLQFDRPMTEVQLDALRPLVARRGRREPLAYLLGTSEFAGLTLTCDRRALIPRPETEELVDLVAERMKGRAALAILDLGTGTGAIALALAKALPTAAVTAVDASAQALALARENAEANGLADRVTFADGDWFAGVSGPFDAVVSNPPYLTEAEFASAQPEVREFEPRGALVSGVDGLDALRRVVTEAPRFLNTGGFLALETGIAQHAALADLAGSAGFRKWESRRDLARRDRFFLASV